MLEPLKLYSILRENAHSQYKQLLHSVASSRWMNERPAGNQAYSPTMKEHLANIATHGVLVVPAACLSRGLLESAGSHREAYAAAVYGLVLTGLFTVSTIFHSVSAFSKNSVLRDLFHRGDRAMIYLFIAGSYTPWLHLRDFSGPSVELRWLVWVLATMGIVYQQLFHEKYKALETFFYVVIALLPSLAVLEMKESEGVLELQIGGAVYMLGVFFFKSDGVIPLAHAIWHIHVVIGALVHFYAVQTYLIPIPVLTN